MSHDPNRERTKAELAAAKKLHAIARTLPEVTEARDGFGHTVFKVIADLMREAYRRVAPMRLVKLLDDDDRGRA